MNQNLSVAEWHKMAQDGNCLPMRIQVSGISMFPLLRNHRDYVTILPIQETPRQGDIILFSDPHREKRYVLHRVWQVGTEAVLSWGDNCSEPDGWIPFPNVLGKAVLIERGKRKIEPDPAKGLRLAKYWHVWGKGYRFARRAIRWVLRRIKKRIGTDASAAE